MLEPNKILDLDSGRVMVVTDLHGNMKDYEQVMRTFEDLKAGGEADYLVIEGDAIHGYPGYEDRSKDILDNLIERGANTPDSDILVLPGNHDVVHIYHIQLAKGQLQFTQGLEDVIADDRDKYMQFLKSMPFAVRTAGGVLLNHSGASAIIGTGQEGEYGVDFDYFKNWPHDIILREVSQIADVNWFPSHTDAFNPAIGAIFSEKRRGQFMWETLMNKNEHSYGEDYFSMVPRFLEFMGTGHKTRLAVMVNGHIQVGDGMKRVCGQQLRLSSGYGAGTDADKVFLVFDASETYADASELVPLCRKLYSPYEGRGAD